MSRPEGDRVQARILGCADLSVPERWLRQAATIATVDDALSRLIARINRGPITPAEKYREASRNILRSRSRNRYVHHAQSLNSRALRAHLKLYGAEARVKAK